MYFVKLKIGRFDFICSFVRSMTATGSFSWLAPTGTTATTQNQTLLELLAKLKQPALALNFEFIACTNTDRYLIGASLEIDSGAVGGVSG